METIELNGKKYYSEPIVEKGSEIKIVVLQRGWVLIGYFSRDGNNCSLTKAKVIRRWGTTKGLGELAVSIPSDTILDPCNGLVEFDILTVVLMISVNEDMWKKEL